MTELPHYEISSKAARKLLESRTEILKRFDKSNDDDRAVREVWRKWFDIYAPVSDDVGDYAAQLKRKGVMYSTPLRSILFNEGTLMHRDIASYDELDRLNNDDIVWPELVADAMPSVASSFCENPPPPRIYRNSDNAWIASVETFKISTQEYFSSILPAFTTDVLKYILKNVLTYNCNIPPTTGNIIYYFFVQQDLCGNS